MLNLINEIVVDCMLYQPAKGKSVVGHLSNVTVDVCVTFVLCTTGIDSLYGINF